jgi:hypothetical protein
LLMFAFGTTSLAIGESSGVSVGVADGRAITGVLAAFGVRAARGVAAAGGVTATVVVLFVPAVPEEFALFDLPPHAANARAPISAATNTSCLIARLL